MAGTNSVINFNEKYPNNNSHYDSFEIGLEFQDFVASKLLKELGICILQWSSKKYQFEVGESFQGIEIKYDARSTGDCTYYQNSATNNVGIEIAEKTNKNKEKWIPSGIYRNDNTWLYIVGNYHQFWIFSKKQLIMCHKRKYFPNIKIETLESMLIPIEKADIMCCNKIIC